MLEWIQEIQRTVFHLAAMKYQPNTLSWFHNQHHATMV